MTGFCESELLEHLRHGRETRRPAILSNFAPASLSHISTIRYEDIAIYPSETIVWRIFPAFELFFHTHFLRPPLFQATTPQHSTHSICQIIKLLTTMSGDAAATETPKKKGFFKRMSAKVKKGKSKQEEPKKEEVKKVEEVATPEPATEQETPAAAEEPAKEEEPEPVKEEAPAEEAAPEPETEEKKAEAEAKDAQPTSPKKAEEVEASYCGCF